MRLGDAAIALTIFISHPKTFSVALFAGAAGMLSLSLSTAKSGALIGPDLGHDDPLGREHGRRVRLGLRRLEDPQAGKVGAVEAAIPR